MVCQLIWSEQCSKTPTRLKLGRQKRANLEFQIQRKVIPPTKYTKYFFKKWNNPSIVWWCKLIFCRKQTISNFGWFVLKLNLKKYFYHSGVLFKWERFIQMRRAYFAPSSLFPLFYGGRKEASRKLSCEWKISIEHDTTVPLEFFTNFAMVYYKECSYLFWISIENNSLRTWCPFCFDFPPQMFWVSCRYKNCPQILILQVCIIFVRRCVYV